MTKDIRAKAIIAMAALLGIYIFVAVTSITIIHAETIEIRYENARVMLDEYGQVFWADDDPAPAGAAKEMPQQRSRPLIFQ